MILLEGRENPPEYDNWEEGVIEDQDEPDQDISQEHVSIGKILMMRSE